MTDERSEAERDEEAIEHLKAQLTSANAEIWRLKRDRNDHHYATDHLAAKDATIACIAKHLDDAAKELRCPHVLAIESVVEKAEAVCIGALTASVERENKSRSWSKPTEEYPSVEVGDRVAVIVMEREHATAPIRPRLVILIATESGWDSTEEMYQGYTPNDGVLWSAENDICRSAATIAAQAAEIERLTKEAVANEAAIACAEGIHQQQDAELAALRSQLEEQRAKLDGVTRFEFPSANKFYHSVIVSKSDRGQWGVAQVGNGVYWYDKKFSTQDEAFQWVAANWLAPHAEKDGGE